LDKRFSNNLKWLSPTVGIVPGQLLALYLSLAKNVDSENPRGLKKITLTYQSPTLDEVNQKTG